MSRRHRNAHPCPTPTKIPFGTEGAALEAIVRINAESEPARQMPMRAYRCACASWHMTSRSMSYDEIAARMAQAPRVLAYEALPDQWRDLDSGAVTLAEEMPDA